MLEYYEQKYQELHEAVKDFRATIQDLEVSPSCVAVINAALEITHEAWFNGLPDHKKNKYFFADPIIIALEEYHGDIKRLAERLLEIHQTEPHKSIHSHYNEIKISLSEADPVKALENSLPDFRELKGKLYDAINRGQFVRAVEAAYDIFVKKPFSGPKDAVVWKGAFPIVEVEEDEW